MSSKSWEAQAQSARDTLEKSIQKQWLLPADKLPSPDRLNVIDVPQECGLLSHEELQITETDATGLVEKMSLGAWTAETVLVAFMKRATIGHQLVCHDSLCFYTCLSDHSQLNFATEFMFEEALEQARALDEHFRRTGSIVGPLHGVPISVKEMVSFKNRVTHTGFVGWADRVSPVDAVMVNVLRRAGAVLFVRTNLPQTCMVRKEQVSQFLDH